MLSTIIITKNEQSMIADCLDSISFSDEIIVIDTGNTDLTNTIARAKRATIFPVKATNYSEFREAGLKTAKGDWILYVDADERVTPELKSEILDRVKETNTDNVYSLQRTNIYLGIPMHYGGWGDDCVIRLFPKSNIHGWKGELHEQPVFSGSLRNLSGKLLHYSHRDLTSMVKKTLVFTKYEAKLRYDSHHPKIAWWRFFRVMFTEFWYRFIRKNAWRDGPRGIIDGLFQVYNSFIIYARLWEMQHESRSS